MRRVLLQGRINRRLAFFETAQDGTLFFDEIGNITPNVQAKLLQFIDTKTFHRVGSTMERTSNARLIFATNKDIPKLVSDNPVYV